MPATVLHIFPPGLDHSILMVVWVGVLWLFLFAETFGWGVVGLVVPGYLASIFISRPICGVATLIEVLLTYLLVRAHVDGIPRLGLMASSFGRERFYLVMLWGTCVRLTCETWLFPLTIAQLPPDLAAWLELDLWHPDFYGIGLVLVPLTANMLWRFRLVRAGSQLLIATLLTWITVTYVLLPYTNLSLSEFQLLYEDAALGLTESPKPYIILLVAALVAARANLLYGWDYNGIMVPSLLAIAWLWPVRVASTLIEVVVVVAVTRLVVKLPYLRGLNIEGFRRTVMILTMDIVYKLVLASAAPALHASLTTADLFGFGYLLPALLATKVWVKRDAVAVLMPTMWVSAQGFVAGSIVAFTLQQLPLPQAAPSPPVTSSRPTRDAPTDTLESFARRGVEMVGIEGAIAPNRGELQALNELLRGQMTPRRTGELHEVSPSGVAGLRKTSLEHGPQRWIGWSEEAQNLEAIKGRGTYVLSTHRDEAVPLAVIMPPDREGAYHSRATLAATLFQRLEAQVLAIPGVRWTPELDLELSPYGRASLQGLAVMPRLWVERAASEAEEGLYIVGTMPADIDLEVLRTLLGPIDLHFSRAPGDALHARQGGPGEAVLLLSDDRCESAVSSLSAPGPIGVSGTTGHSEQTGGTNVGAPSSTFTPASAGACLSAGSTTGTPQQLLHTCLSGSMVPSMDEGAVPSGLWLSLFRSGVAVPLVQTMRSGVEWTDQNQARLAALAHIAPSLGYRLVRLPAKGTPALLILAPLSPARSDDVLLLLRPGYERPWVLELADPSIDGMLPLAERLFSGLEARALLIGGAQSIRPGKEGAELEHVSGPAEVLHQALVEGLDRPTVLRLEASSPVRPLPADLAISAPTLLISSAPRPSWLLPLEQALSQLGLRSARQDGAPWAASLRLPASALSRYSSWIGEDRQATLWIGRPLRQRAEKSLEALLPPSAALELETITADVISLLQHPDTLSVFAPGKVGARSKHPQEARDGLESALDAWEDFARQGGPSRLQHLLEKARSPGRRLVLVQDEGRARQFLLSLPPHGNAERWCINLSALPARREARTLEASASDRSTLKRFADGFAPGLWVQTGKPDELARRTR